MILQPFNRIDLISVKFDGPYSDDLWDAIYRTPSEFDLHAVGSGATRYEAAMHALDALETHPSLGKTFDIVKHEVRNALPSYANEVEGDNNCSIRCSLGVKGSA